ncbi:hypothetical protein C2D64_08510 [Listeria ivanovii]|uniref:DUF262 domain-containing protein n=1 Tax=Listeria ivanovii TaxID=1638 RepID=UPI000DA6EBDC|nr:DUF262 domain-containing protein [Listeria ivanovii]PZG33375.1 hypothetical protein C2D64_08510 [Listeria ivanovii]PZG47118.1 hypothetical protein C2D66_08210 [Listeria ivanovii]PZH11026.1 hypothetical protein C2D65_08460 [Listeria ivanovii]
MEKITIGINVEKDGIKEQIDVHFIKENSAEGSNIYYNQKNGYMDKREVIITENVERSNFKVEIEFGDYIVDELDEIRQEFDKAYNEKKVKLESFDEDEDENDGDANNIEMKPYDPTLIRVDQKQFTIENTVNKIGSKEIDLNPDFQRKFVWTDITRKSRLIESILLRIPLPVFYLSEDEDGIYHVLDGLQRLTVLNSYLNNEFRLKNLEYLEKECGGRFFEPEDKNLSKKHNQYLPTKYVRRIRDTMLNFNVVDSSTPEPAKYDIFRRINTGGKPLNRQEMRNAMATLETRKLLGQLSNLEIFKKATGYSVKDTRFADQELVLRFIGFYLIDNQYKNSIQYKGVMATFLDEVIEVLNKYYSSKDKFINRVFLDFETAMHNSYRMFGDKGFKRTQVINKALFLSVARNSYNFKLDNELDVVENIKKRDAFFNKSNNDFWDSKIKEYDEKSNLISDSLSTGTNEILKIQNSYNIMNELMEVLINESDYNTTN